MGSSMKSFITLAIITLMLTSAIFMVTLSFSEVKAQTNVLTSLSLSVDPNPAEVNQTITTVKVQIEPPSPNHSDTLSFKLTSTRPDGYVITDTSETNASGFSEFNMSLAMIGNWTLKARFEGQDFDNGAIHYQLSEQQITFTRLSGSESDFGSWVSRASMQQARSGLGVASVNGKIYAIGGSTASGFAPSSPAHLIITNQRFVDGFVGTNEEYDPATDTWSYKSSMPTPRIGFATAVFDGKIYCIGGRTSSGSYTGINEVYNPGTDTWETKTPMPISKGWITANVIDEKIFVMGGGVYDPTTDSWDVKESITPYDGYLSASIGNKVYAIGGFSEDGQYNLNRIYNVETDKFSEGSYPPSTVAAGGAVATIGGDLQSGNVYVLGVTSNLRQGEPENFVRIYNPANDSWSLGTSPEFSHVFNFGVTSINGEIYVIGGLTYDGLEYKPSDINQMYTPIGVIADEPSNTPEPTVDNPPEAGWGPLLTPIIILITLAVITAIGLLLYFKKYRR